MNVPNITDWINSFGVLFTVILGIIGYLNLKKDSKSQEDKINKLTDLATESQKQTKLMQLNYEMYFQENMNRVKPDFIFDSQVDSTYYLKNIGKGSATVTNIYCKNNKFRIEPTHFNSTLPYFVRIAAIYVFTLLLENPSELINEVVTIEYLDENNVTYILHANIINSQLTLSKPVVALFSVPV